MQKFPSLEQLAVLEVQLEQSRDLPRGQAVQVAQLSCWHVFRQRQAAMDFARNIMLDGGDSLIGGRVRDSIGDLWWVGVHVDDDARWAELGGVQHVAQRDPECPNSGML